MGEITRLTEEITWPISEEDIIRWPYFREVIGIITRELGNATNTTINILLDQTGNTFTYYFGVPDDAGIYPTNTWRIIVDSTSYSEQQYDGAAWVEKRKLTSDKLLTTGAIGLGSVTITSDYTIPDSVYMVTCNATSSINVTLPALTGNRSLVVSNNEGKANATMVGTVNGSVNPTLFAGETMDLTDNGTEWRV